MDVPVGQGDPTSDRRNPDAASFMNVSPDNMFYMLNFAKLREIAKYDDGRETNLSGRETDGLYDPTPEIRKVGGGLVYAGNVAEQLTGSGLFQS